jgi:polyferredoxin
MEAQTYANHRHRPTLWYTGALAALVAFVLIVRLVIRDPSLVNVALLLLAYAACTAVYVARLFALKVQDHIIRLEMQTRLARLGREADLARLSPRQIIALRFASDAELPTLLQRAVAERMTGDQIKRAITSWQADTMRT